MKKFASLLLAGMLFAFTTNAQVCTYECTGNQVNFNSLLVNQNYNGNSCFTAPNGVINNSVNWNGWNILTFNGNITVNQAVNFQNGAKKVYVASNSNMIFSQISFDGNDTLRILENSAVLLQNFVTNNSGGNAIVLSQGSMVTINNVSYTGTSYIQTVNTNPTNSITIYPCGFISGPLPITLEFFKLEKGVLIWRFNSVTDANYVELEHLEAERWVSLEGFYPYQNVVYTRNSIGGLYRLKITDNNNKVYYSSTINDLIHMEDSNVEIYDTMGRRISKREASELPANQFLIIKRQNSVEKSWRRQ